MPVFLGWIVSVALKTVTGWAGAGVVSAIAPIVSALSTAAPVVINAVLGGLLDASRTPIGRAVILAAMAFFIGAWVQAHYTYVSRAELASLQAQVSKLSASNAQLARRPAAAMAENARMQAQVSALAKRPEVCPAKRKKDG
jgi:hypothetical protein